MWGFEWNVIFIKIKVHKTSAWCCNFYYLISSSAFLLEHRHYKEFSIVHILSDIILMIGTSEFQLWFIYLRLVSGFRWCWLNEHLLNGKCSLEQLPQMKVTFLHVKLYSQMPAPFLFKCCLYYLSQMYARFLSFYLKNFYNLKYSSIWKIAQ